MKASTSIFAAALVLTAWSREGRANEVNNGALPLEFTYRDVTRHLSILQRNLQAGQAITYLLTETTTNLDAHHSPTTYATRAVIEVRVKSVDTQNAVIETTLASNWAGADMHVLRDTVRLRDDTLIKSEVCSLAGVCQAVARTDAARYRSKSLEADRSSAKPALFELDARDDAVVLTPAGAIDSTMESYSAQKSETLPARPGHEDQTLENKWSLSAWASNETAVLTAARITLTHTLQTKPGNMGFSQVELVAIKSKR